MLNKAIKVLPLLAITGLLAGCGSGQQSSGQSAATPASPPGTVVATVNGHAITAPEINAYVAMRTRGAKIQLNNTQKRVIARELAQVSLAAQAAVKAKLLDNPNVRAGLDLQRNLYLANVAIRHYLDTHSPSEQALRKAYEKMVKAQSGEEYKARHILVKTKAEAEKIITQLDHGADFAKLAAKDSIGPSAKQGGELGWFKPNQMVPAFSSAVAKLKPGSYTKAPVHTQFGWHVIELQKERTAAPPSFTAMKPTLVNQSKRAMVQKYLGQLGQGASIDIKLPAPSTTATQPAKVAPTRLEKKPVTAAPAKTH